MSTCHVILVRPGHALPWCKEARRPGGGGGGEGVASTGTLFYRALRSRQAQHQRHVVLQKPRDAQPSPTWIPKSLAMTGATRDIASPHPHPDPCISNVLGVDSRPSENNLRLVMHMSRCRSLRGNGTCERVNCMLPYGAGPTRQAQHQSL